ncbi:unnamed protein product [Rotaria sordida]|uniref:Uncharacterized protein n=1 Tax=Rotaria sordida TaxID=392033 RepID=A0A820EU18_9BILA|nr:unnamed protein product [Rotaria sordida]
MASFSFQQCNISSCTHEVFAACECCHLNICTIHINEHSNQRNAQFTSLVDEIKTLTNRISSFELPFLVNLEQWRLESQRILDSFCNEKRQTFLKNRIEELDRLRLIVEDLVRMQDTTPENINEIKTLIHQIEQDLTHIRFNFHPLIIDENLIVQFSQDLLPCASSHRMIKLTTYSYAVLASNTKHLLVHRDPNLCLLDRQLTIIKQTPWPLDISDICWSSTLDRFIVVTLVVVEL